MDLGHYLQYFYVFLHIDIPLIFLLFLLSFIVANLGEIKNVNIYNSNHNYLYVI